MTPTAGIVFTSGISGTTTGYQLGMHGATNIFQLEREVVVYGSSGRAQEN